jgi:hypothetical protein
MKASSPFCCRFVAEPNQTKQLVFALAPQCFHILALALNLGLIGVDLPLLIRLTVFLALQLIPNQYAGPEAKSAADRRSRTRMANRRANDPTCGSSAERTNAGAFFTRAEATTGTAEHEKTEQTKATESANRLLHRTS